MSHQVLLLFAMLSGLAFSFLGLSYKAADSARCRITPFIAVFTAIAGIISLIYAHCETSTWGDPRIWYLGLIGGVGMFSAIYLVVRTNMLGPASITWTIVNLSLLVPIVIFALFFRERFYWVDLVSLTLFVLMLLAFAHSVSSTNEVQPHQRVLFVTALLVLFFVNGIWMFLGKLKYTLLEAAQAGTGITNTGSFSAIAYFTASLLALGVYLAREGRQPFHRNEWRVGVMAGVSSVAGMLLFLLASGLASTVLYPVSEGIALLGGVALTAIIFKERIDGYKVAGIVLGIAVLLVSVLREPIAGLFSS